MISLKQIKLAAKNLEGKVFNTPLLNAKKLGEGEGRQVWLKLESEQATGSFKARGALNKVINAGLDKHFYTASTGNHALGFARALKMTGAQGTVYMPRNASEKKVTLVKEQGVEVIFYGDDCLESELKAKEVALERDGVWVSPYNDVDVICGQATVGLEILDCQSEFDYVFVCVGGGGLISGIGSVMKHMSPKTKIIGCMPKNSPEMCLSVQNNRYTIVEPQETLSDGSAGPFEADSITFGLCKSLVDDFVLISEDEIIKGIQMMHNIYGKRVEGASAVALMGCLKYQENLKGTKSAVVICGSNIKDEIFEEITG